MAKIEVAPDLIEIFEHAADALHVETYPENKIEDFKNGDVVQCSLLKGVWIVDQIGIQTKRIILRHLTDNDLETLSTVPVKPKYLKKLDKDSKAFKTLFSRNEP